MPRVGFFVRSLFALALAGATHLAQLHPLEHLEHPGGGHAGEGAAHEEHPFERLHTELCDVCVAEAALGATVSARSGPFLAVLGRERLTLPVIHAVRAADPPVFRAQAPPSLL